MPTLHRHHLVLALSLALTACPADESSTGSNGTGDESGGDPTTNSGTVSVTLSDTTPTTDSDPSTGPTTTVDPTTGPTDSGSETSIDPDSSSSAASDPSSESGSESSSSGGSDDDTIYDIQMEVIASGTDVVVQGVVVTGVLDTRFWVQEPGSGEYSGIVVYAADQGDVLGVSDLQIGDVVDVSGTVLEYQDEYTEIDVSQGTGTLVVTGTTTPLEPDLVDISVFGSDDTAEPWESTLVRIEGALDVTALDPMYDEFTVAIGSDEVVIDDFLYDALAADDFPNFAEGATFTAIQGPVNFFIGVWKIMPRSADELEGYSAPL
jgi:predicted extracellular nuclease